MGCGYFFPLECRILRVLGTCKVYSQWLSFEHFTKISKCKALRKMFLCFFCKKVKNLYGKYGDRSGPFVKLLSKIFSKCPAKLLIMFTIKYCSIK